MKIINTRIIFKDKNAIRFSSTFNTNELKDLKPMDVFKNLIENRDMAEKNILLEKFAEIAADTIQS